MKPTGERPDSGTASGVAGAEAEAESVTTCYGKSVREPLPKAKAEAKSQGESSRSKLHGSAPGENFGSIDRKLKFPKIFKD